jgi:hypothetical protein
LFDGTPIFPRGPMEHNKRFSTIALVAISSRQASVSATADKLWSIFVEMQDPGNSALPFRIRLSRRSFPSSNKTLVDIVGASLRVFSTAYANWCLHGCADFVSLARSQFSPSARELRNPAS